MRLSGGRTSSSHPAGVLLRQWRDLRGKSQLDLSLDAGVSQKHISFVESGRSRPSRRMVDDLTEALAVPLRERNAILLAAGYAPSYAEETLDAPSLSRLKDVLQRLLKQNEPFPAVVMDRHWNVLLANDAAPRFFGCFVDLSSRPGPRNLLDLLFDPVGLRPFVADWPSTARMLAARVRRETPGHIVDVDARRLLDRLERYPDADTRGPATGAEAASPVIPLTFVKDGTALSYFSLVTTVGTPRVVAAEELRLECMVPANEATERSHADFVARHRREAAPDAPARFEPTKAETAPPPQAAVPVMEPERR